jgi:hypothetical protein
VVIETAGWEVTPKYETRLLAAELELRPVPRRTTQALGHQALLVVRVGSRELVVRLAPGDVARMHAALSGEEEMR